MSLNELPYTCLNTNNFTKFESIKHWWKETTYNIKTKVTNKNSTTNNCTEVMRSVSKIEIPIDNVQAYILTKWIHIAIDIYNITNKYIRTNITKGNNKYKKSINLIKVRDAILDMKTGYISNYKYLINRIHKNSIPNRLLRSVIKDVVRNYNSSISAVKNGNRETFYIRNYSHKVKKYGFELDRTSFTCKNENLKLFTRTININVEHSEFQKLDHEPRLVYDRISKKLYLHIVKMVKHIDFIPKNKECAIDLGIRTFATVYAKNKVEEFCNDVLPIRKDIKNAKINRDEFKSNYKGSKKKSRKAYLRKIRRLNRKIKNRIDDMQNHIAKHLCLNYKTIYLGDLKSKSAKEAGINKTTKNELDYFCHYKFKQKLLNKADEMGNDLFFIDEAYTSQQCGKCRSKMKTSDKVYKCQKPKCKYHSDRDHNGARNIFIKAINS